MSERLCRDCRWAQSGGWPYWPDRWRFAKCLHPNATEPVRRSLVSGHTYGGGQEWAQVMRGDCGERYCGPEGKLWEPQAQGLMARLRAAWS
jgi:hypothetical protein